MDLPIDIVSEGPPPVFKWRQICNTQVGPRVVCHEGMLPPSLEGAVSALIGIAKQLQRENERLQEERSPHQVPAPPKGKKH